MASLNKVMLIGHLGKDAEIRVLNGGGKKAGFSIATTERYKDKNSGEMVDKTEWHNIVAWNQLAEIVEKLSLKKGTPYSLKAKLHSGLGMIQQVDRKNTSLKLSLIECRF